MTAAVAIVTMVGAVVAGTAVVVSLHGVALLGGALHLQLVRDIVEELFDFHRVLDGALDGARVFLSNWKLEHRFLRHHKNSCRLCVVQVVVECTSA